MFRRNGKMFSRNVDTDGCVINVHFKKANQKKQSGNERNDKDNKTTLVGKRILGLDPGRSNIYTIAEELDTGIHKRYTLTRKQYYTESRSGKRHADVISKV